MSIVLLNIPPAEIIERRYDKPNFPDPSLGAIFTYLRKNNIECKVIDSKLERLSLTGVIKRLKNIKPNVIGFTSFTHEIERAAYVANLIKERFTRTKLIIGGSHVNGLRGQVLEEFPVFDIAVFGEGEETFAELILNNFTGLESIHGISFKKGNEVIINRERAFLQLDKLPPVEWSGFIKARYYPVFTSRGCAYRCIFCSRPFGPRVRYRSIDSVVEEVMQIKESYNPKIIYFWDENFCADKNRVFGLIEKIKKNSIAKKIKWFCQAHINNLDYTLLKFMKESGCVRLGIGIESGNGEVLKKIGKGTTKEKIIQVVGWLKKVRIPFEGHFLLGLPDDNWKSCKETIDFAVKLNPKFPVFGIVVPYPGTEIYTMAMKGEGGYKIIARRWQDYNKLIGKALELKELPRRKLELLQLYGYISVLFRNFRIFDVFRFIVQFNIDIFSYIKNLSWKTDRNGRDN